jgi:hypothetical protein
MRFPSLLTTLAAMAALGCGSTDPSGTLEGKWIGPSRIPGSEIDLALKAAMESIEGDGIRYVEAGRPRAFTVTGGVDGTTVTLSFAYSGGGVASYSGRMISHSHISGKLSEGGAPPVTQDFFKQ